MAQMAIAMARSHLRPAHSVAAIRPLIHILRFDRLCEARPTAVAVKLVQRRKQRLARDDIHVDAGLIMIPIGILERSFRSISLRDLELFRGQASYSLRVLRVVGHLPTSSANLY